MLFVVLLAMGLQSVGPTMPVEEVKPGLRGQCLTVFEGDTVESFDFVVKGVLEDFKGPGRDLILVQLLGEKPEFTGVASGMSGSPCSVDGRLMGALSYSIARFAKQPIAGVTPIQDMLDVMALPDEKRPWRLLGTRGKKQEVVSASWQSFAEGKAVKREQSGAFRPIAAPLSMAGVTPQVREYFSPWLKSMGFEPMAGGRSSSTDDSRRTLAPGEAVAAIMVQGDVNIAATGTVTSVDGDRVTAFGHPFMGNGSISIPMARATIINTLASAQQSFKISATGPVVGELTQDRLPAIAGHLGGAADMLPVRGVVNTPNGEESFQFEVARDFSLTPRYVTMGLASVLGGRIDAGSRGMIRMEAVLEVDGMAPVHLRRVYSAERDPKLAIYAGIDVGRAVATIWSTPFGPPPPIAVEVSVDVLPDPVVEYLESISLSVSSVLPGETVGVAVVLRQVDGPRRVERFDLKVPSSWGGQQLVLVAASAARADGMTRSVEGAPGPNDLSQVMKWLRARRQAGYLYLLALRRGDGLQAAVDAMPFLPGTSVVVLSGTPSSQVIEHGVAWQESRRSPGMVQGSVSTSITVRSY